MTSTGVQTEGEADLSADAAPSLSPLAELCELTALFKAHLDWQLETGASGLDVATQQLIASRPSELSEATAFEVSQVAPSSHTTAARRGAEVQIPAAAQSAVSRGADTRGADTRGADTRGADTRGADTRSADTRGADTRSGVAAQAPPLPAPPTHGSPPPPSAAWERDRGSSQAPLNLQVLRPAQSLAEQAASLKALREAVAGCVACRLHEQRTQTVFARGNGSSGLCFIGEGPGVEEDAQGEPFVGKAGQLLDKMIAAMGLDRDAVYVCDIVKCRPPGDRKPMPDEMQACAGFLHKQIELIAPQVIVALGATAVEGLLGNSGGIMRIRGRWRTYNQRILVMPTYHPAYLLRNPKAKRDVWEDLQQVMAELNRLRGAVPSTPQGS